VNRVVEHIACRIVGVAAGGDAIIRRVDRWIKTIPRLQRGLRHPIAIAIVTVGVVLYRALRYGPRRQTVEPIIAKRYLLIENRVGRIQLPCAFPGDAAAVNLRSSAAVHGCRSIAHPPPVQPA
jgi:hypothetical protein